MNFNTFPKVELHLHLDGSLNLELLKKITNYDLSYLKDQAIATDSKNLKEYLKKFDFLNTFLQTKENLTTFTKQLVNDLINDHVLYAEIRFAPNKHTKEGLSLDEVVKAVLKGLNWPLKVNLILCMMREDKLEDNLKIIDLAYKYRHKGVCAIDLAGDEKNYPTKNYQKLFAYANNKKINYTIHAGEVGDLTSLKNALEFNPSRIGHGIAAINSKEIQQELKNKDILLEICPTSNVDTKIVKNYCDHPIKELHKNLKVSISTDNRTVSNITLTKEYEKLAQEIKKKKEDFLACNLAGLNKAFISKRKRSKLIKKYLKSYQNWEISQKLHSKFTK